MDLTVLQELAMQMGLIRAAEAAKVVVFLFGEVPLAEQVVVEVCLYMAELEEPVALLVELAAELVALVESFAQVAQVHQVATEAITVVMAEFTAAAVVSTELTDKAGEELELPKAEMADRVLFELFGDQAEPFHIMPFN
jgi:hypothetical protein